ncbi:hypothetical protein F751_5371 [Auxenochlorella protothecoides]|uniref:Uncharacterized protein n=1 Tax=Auxenochlorella protothecoides TaxID=3075 RepID=A0A087SP61_AUXPR|nr:hypothetical protein F751_5371 [Auxenochlorella protothecoides]KFM27515.1 hypothetical protein F751_5371 [Auxenochlorella protothecoides]
MIKVAHSRCTLPLLECPTTSEMNWCRKCLLRALVRVHHTAHMIKFEESAVSLSLLHRYLMS